MRLYHYTCPHAAPLIERDGFLRPNPHPFMPEAGPLVWLTDMRHPQRAGLGLTSMSLTCDRTVFRFDVDCDAEPWASFADRIGVTSDVRSWLEWRSKSHRWFVATGPVPVGQAVPA